MKFIINREEFSKRIQNASRIINSNNPLHSLRMIKLELTADGLVITSSNGELNVQTTIFPFLDNKQILRNTEEGGVLVDAKLITEIVKRLDGDEIKFEVLDGSLAKIEGSSSNYNLNVVRVEEFTDLDFSKSGSQVQILSKDLLSAINEVAFAASLKDQRVLNGVNVECTCSSLTFTATDGARLAKKVIDIENKDVFNVIIPSKTLLEVARTLENEKEIEIYVSEKKVVFSFKDTIISSKLISGDYPNVRNVIPKSFNYFLEVNAQDFLSSMSKVSFLSSERESVVKVIMQEGKVMISSKSEGNATADALINLFKYSGEKLEISFNSEFVSNAIRALGSQDVLISFVGEMKPFTITNKEDPSIIQLVTPVRTY